MSFQQQATFSKGQDVGKSPLRPGDSLRGRIAECRENGRKVWRLGPYVAPRIENIAVRRPEDGEPILYRPLAVDLDHRAYFRHRALLWLETGEPLAFKQLQAHDHAQLRRLAATVARDLHGALYNEIPMYSDEKTARERIKEGRELWHRLCAWPWCYWPEGEEPDGWQKHGASTELAAAFETWATAAPVLPNQNEEEDDGRRADTNRTSGGQATRG